MSPPDLFFISSQAKTPSNIFRSPTITTALEISRILHRLGCDVRLFNPCSLPVHTSAPQTHPAILELHDLALWSDGHIWVSPSMHGSLPSVFKNQLDSISLTTDRMHPTAGRTLAIISVSEYREGSRVNSRWGDEARDVSNEMRALGQFMRMWMITQPCFIGSDSFEELNSGLRLRAGQDRIGLVDCLEEFVKFSILMRGSFKSFGDRFSDRLMNKNGPVSR
jgi:arsenic resistance protein ArsH